MNDLIEIEIKQVSQQVFEILSDEDLSRATQVVKGIKGLKENIEKTFNPIVDKAYQAHREAISQRDTYLKPLQDVEKKIKNNILIFTNKKIADQRERERIANEALAKVAEAKKQELLSKASESNEWESEVLKETAESIKPLTVDVQKKVIEQEGLTIAQNWKFEIINEDLLPREYLIPNEAMLGKMAKQMKDKSDVPGVRFYNAGSVRI